MDFATILKALQLAAAAADAAVKAKEIALALKAAAQQQTALTPQQSQELDSIAEQIFAAPESQLSGR